MDDADKEFEETGLKMAILKSILQKTDLGFLSVKISNLTFLLNEIN